MKDPLFLGACTALVTPFRNGKLNETMVEALIDRQLEAGIHTIVLGGTTGEAPTLSDAEKLRLYFLGKKRMETGITICGTGSNDTTHAIALSQAAEDAGADALLVVSPYYNKANEQGIINHFTAIASAVHIPIILYNVPGRTGLDIPVGVYKELANIPNIAGVKEAAADIRKILQIRSACPEDFFIWSGNDDMIVPMMALGAVGVISVASNVTPEEVRDLALAALAGDYDTAAALQIYLKPLTDILFQEVNPIPVKEAMAVIGYDCGPCRLPLGAMTDENRKRLEKVLSSL